MKGSFTVEKVLNNNVLIATHDRYSEVVLIGKGIGFGKKQADVIEDKGYDKMFILKDEKEQKQFKKLLGYVDETLVDISNDVIYHIKKRTSQPLNEHIHIALTDHIAFAVKRPQRGF